jgi:RND family efflux transporter MFP subunit
MHRKFILTLFLGVQLWGTGPDEGMVRAQDSESTPYLDTVHHGLALPRKSAILEAGVSGTVAAILVEEGARVRAGQALIRLDSRVASAEADAALRVSEHAAALRGAELELARTTSRRNRLHEAARSGASSAIEIADAENQWRRAETVVEGERERRQQLRDAARLAVARLAQFEIVAPFDGRVLRIHVSPGEGTNSQGGLLRIADLRTLSVEIYLPMTSFGEYEVGQDIELSAGAPVNQTLSGRIVFLSPEIDAPTRAFRCVLDIDNSDERLPAGFHVQLPPTAQNKATRARTGR